MPTGGVVVDLEVSKPQAEVGTGAGLNAGRQGLDPSALEADPPQHIPPQEPTGARLCRP